MKIIAFFNLQENTDINDFNDWVLNIQTKLFEKTQPKMKNFKIYKLVDSDNYGNLHQIVQIFDWDGTPDDWRKELKKFWDPNNKEAYKVKLEWMNYCVDESTGVLYADDI